MVIDKRFTITLKALIENHENKFLLLKKCTEDAHAWIIPRMNIEFGENIYTSLWQKVKQNTGLDIDIIRPSNISSKVTRDVHDIHITFFCKTSGNKVKLNEENCKASWATSDTILKSKIPKWLKDDVRAVQNKIVLDDFPLYKKFDL